MKALEAGAAALFLACWVLFFLHVAGWASLAGRLPLSLYALYSAASAFGWLAGAVYVQRTPLNGEAT